MRALLSLALSAALLGAAPAEPGRAIAVIPFDLVGGHIFVDARIDGGPPLRMAIDTGSGNVLATDTAAALHIQRGAEFDLHGTGEQTVEASAARVDAIELGSVTLRDQHLTLLPFGDLRAAEGVARFDGLIGHELFDRFDVRIDYALRVMTLYEPGTAPRDPSGVAVPIAFEGTMPDVRGDVDGIPGTFTIDTGDRGSFSLTVPFVEEHDLVARYRPRVEGIAGWGIGGPVRAKLTRVGDLRFGGIDVANPVTRLPDAQHGFFTSRSIAGNIGYGVLHRFTLTFDYRDRELFLTPNAAVGDDVYDRSGMWLVDAAGGFRVVDVFAGSPAERAGVRVGDLIESVDGREATDVGLVAARDTLRAAPGTAVSVRLVRGADTLDVTLRLADVV